MDFRCDRCRAELVAAALYCAGARLDKALHVLFTLRGVDHAELIGDGDLPTTRISLATERVLAEDDVAALPEHLSNYVPCAEPRFSGYP